MLEYGKVILQKVSFDKGLFEKELRKTIARLMPREVDELRQWCYTQFGDMHYLVLDRCFIMTLT